MAITTEGEKSQYSSQVAELGSLILDPPSGEELAKGLGNLAIQRAKSMTISKVTKEASRVFGPLGLVANYVMDAVGDKMKESKEDQASLKGIEALSKNNVPGMVYKETIINGTTYKIGIDASSQIALPEASPRVMIDIQAKSSFDDDGSGSYNPAIDLKDPALIAQVNAMKNVANASIEGYKQEVAANLPEEKAKYRQATLDYLDKVDNATPTEVALLSPPQNPLGAETRYTEMLSKQISDTTKALTPDAPSHQSQGVAIANSILKNALTQ